MTVFNEVPGRKPKIETEPRTQVTIDLAPLKDAEGRIAGMLSLRRVVRKPGQIIDGLTEGFNVGELRRERVRALTRAGARVLLDGINRGNERLMSAISGGMTPQEGKSLSEGSVTEFPLPEVPPVAELPPATAEQEQMVYPIDEAS